jgi:acyl-coenzyme A thioesterase PaaI-like protein
MSSDSAGGERQELADAVRRLMAATVTAAASPDELAEVAAMVQVAVDRLEAVGASGSGPPIARYGEDPRSSDGQSPLAHWMPFDVIVGRCNPVAPPVTVTFEGERAIGHVVFTATYEGAPGCVHGAVIAGTFDIILTAANVLADAAGPTTELSIRYLRPTLVGVPSRFESWVTAADGRRTSSRGQLIQEGQVTVEAEGVFAPLSRARIDALHRRGGSDPSDGPGRPAEPQGSAEPGVVHAPNKAKGG